MFDLLFASFSDPDQERGAGRLPAHRRRRAITATAVFKNAPHPNSAWLFYRWLIGEEGQKVFAAAGRTPAHPKVEPVDKTRPHKIYAIDDKDYKEFARYEKIWKEIFKLR
jgi:ABC-type Fe3+ transport system substrate-binding protein